MKAPASTPVARLRRPRLLIIGCGDVGLRLLRQLAPRIAAGHLSVVAVTRDPGRRASARKLGARALGIDLDNSADPTAWRRLGALARRTLYLAPPPATGVDDPRLGRLLAARARTAGPGSAAAALTRWVLVSTTGVYGDCAGARVDESRPPAPTGDRARRRLAAERRVRGAVSRGSLQATILRAPGLYAHDRLPTARLRRGLPVPVHAEDPWVNLVHADDLAAATWLALHRGLPGRAVNVVDDSTLTMGGWLDRVADACGLARPPRLPRQQLGASLSPAMLGFLDESRRLSNRRLKRELRARLRWPTADAALTGAGAALLPDPATL